MPDGSLVGLMFPALFALVLIGIPISFSLILTSAAFGWLFFGAALPSQLLGKLEEVTAGFIFAAIPMFVLMGALLERAGLAERLFEALQLWLGRLPGGLALAAMAMGAIIGGPSGIVGAVEVVVGLMAIPVMLRHGYDKGLIAGTITSAGSLGTIIPPSVTAVVLAGIAQLSVSDLHAGTLLPGAIMVGLFMAYILVRCRLQPRAGPALPPAGEAMPLRTKLDLTLRGLIPATILILAVIGTSAGGIASPTEAAAVGAVGAALLAFAHGRLTRRVVSDAVTTTLQVTSFIMLLVVGGAMFSSVFYVLGGGQLVRDVIAAAGFGPSGTVLLFLAIVFIAGFILDWATIVLVTVPIFMPIVQALAIDPLWFAILLLVTIQTSYLTPPMAPAIFYLRAIAPPSITYADMVRGVLPFIACQLLTLLAVWLAPALATWLPAAIGGF